MVVFRHRQIRWGQIRSEIDFNYLRALHIICDTFLAIFQIRISLFWSMTLMSNLLSIVHWIRNKVPFEAKTSCQTPKVLKQCLKIEKKMCWPPKGATNYLNVTFTSIFPIIGANTIKETWNKLLSYFLTARYFI